MFPPSSSGLFLSGFRSVMAAAVLLLFLLISSPTLSFSQTDADVLMKLKESFIGGDQFLTNWWISGPESSPCDEKWEGVRCRKGTIVGLHLTEYNLSGTIDIQALLQLPYLRSVSFMSNSFEGPIPEFNKLGALKSIYLSNNWFSGEIPKDFFYSMHSLKKLWLTDNKFTGNIPESVMRLPQLQELHLEENLFSGEIPRPAIPNSLKSVNFTANKLEGQIPESLTEFGAASFEGNKGLCGEPLPTACANKASSPSDENKPQVHKTVPGSHGKAMLAGTTILIVLCFIIASLFSTRRGDTKEEENGFSVKSMQYVPDVVLPVSEPRQSVDRKSESSDWGSTPGIRKDSKNGGLVDLVMVNAERGKIGMQDLMMAGAELLGNGAVGSAYKAVLPNGLSVVVKRMREMNRLGNDEFDVEMRRFGTLNHPNILTPLAYHYRKEEKLIVSEYMPTGSLLYVLHGTRDVVHANLNWRTRLKIIKGIVRGLDYIHKEYAKNEVPHGNLKSSNILLTEKYDPLLSDYAFTPLTNAEIGAQELFAYKSPEYVEYQQVSHKSDIYCLGVVILEIMTGKYPSQYLSNAKGGIDVVQWVQLSILENQGEELIDPDIANNAGGSVDQMVQVLKIGAACAEINPEKRLDINEVVTRIEGVS